MLLAPLGSALLAQVAAADISIDLGSDSALVDARYELVASVESVDLTLIRLKGQSLRFPSGNPPITSSARGLYRLNIEHGGEPIREACLQYVVLGDLSRVPIAVPDLSPVAEGARVRVKVSGLSRTASLEDGFPRLIPQVPGRAAAELETVPNFLRAPPDARSWSVNRLADTSVLVMVLFATAIWLVRRRVRARLMTA